MRCARATGPTPSSRSIRPACRRCWKPRGAPRAGRRAHRRCGDRNAVILVDRARARPPGCDRAATWFEIYDGGLVKIATGVTEIGEGILTVLAQIAAEEIGVRPEDVVIADNDTARVPEAAHAGATRQTYMIGNSVAIACREAKGRFVAAVADMWKVEPEPISTGNGYIWAAETNYRVSMAEAVERVKKRGVVAGGSASFTAQHTGPSPEDGSGTPWQAYVFGCQVAEVEVDTSTGEVQ